MHRFAGRALAAVATLAVVGAGAVAAAPVGAAPTPVPPAGGVQAAPAAPAAVKPARPYASWALPVRTLRYPAGAVVDVRRAYGAKGDGRTDDTEALRRAVRENLGRILFLRAGVYLVSGTIEGVDRDGRPQPFMMLQGSHRDKVVIKLKRGAAGFGDRRAPRPVLKTSSGVFVEQPRPDGAGNEAFGNTIENLTVDTGRNAGAVGVAFHASNYGAVRDVAVRGRGVTGIDMTRGVFGPGLVKNVAVTGFDVGIDVDATEYGATLEHLRLSGQRVAGLRDRGGSIAVRDLRSRNAVPALDVTGAVAQVSLVDAVLTRGSAKRAAIRLATPTSGLFARGIRAEGYRAVIDHAGRRVGTTKVSEWTSAPVQAPFGGSRRSLDLPVRETPRFTGDPKRWADVRRYGAVADDWVDDSAAIQRALDSGRSTVYLPTGRYLVGTTLRVPGTVRRIAGLNSTVAPVGPAFADPADRRAVFRVGGTVRAGLIVDKLHIGKLVQSQSQAGLVGFDHVGRRSLTLQDGSCCGERGLLTVRSRAGSGPLFVENWTADIWDFRPGQQVWARQLNPEGGQRRILNRGGTAWILGLKMEGAGSTLETTRGGCSELLGATLYVFDGLERTVPYVNVDSSVSISGVTTAYGDDDYRTHVRETRDGVTREVGRDRLAWRGDGRSMPLYTSGTRAGCPG